MANSKFTRYHYRVIAEVICQNVRASTLQSRDGGDFVFLNDLVDALAEVFAEDSDSFRREQFQAACHGKVKDEDRVRIDIPSGDHIVGTRANRGGE